MKPKVIVDHNGTTWSSISTMLRELDIAKSTYYDKKKQGMSLSGIIETSKRRGPVQDCFGNTYPSIKAMYTANNLTKSQYYWRIANGYTPEQAGSSLPTITGNIKNRKINDRIYIIKTIQDKEKGEVIYYYVVNLDNEELIMRLQNILGELTKNRSI